MTLYTRREQVNDEFHCSIIYVIALQVYASDTSMLKKLLIRNCLDSMCFNYNGIVFNEHTVIYLYQRIIICIAIFIYHVN